MKRYVTTLLLLIILIPCLNAQKKEVAQARAFIKSGKNLDKAEQQMRALLKDSANKQNLKVWTTLTDAVRAQYLAGNENLYLKQKQDTAALFNLARKMFIDYQGLDSIDALPDGKGNVKLKYRHKNAAFLDSYRPNLYNGGVFFIRKANFRDASLMMDVFLDCRNQPLFEQMHYEKDTLNRTAAFWMTFCGYKLQQPELTLKYKELALKDTAHLEKTLQFLAETYKAQEDMTSYEQTLRAGFGHYPESAYFFPRLIDFYNAGQKPDSAMAITDRALAVNGKSELFLYAKSNLLLNAGKYDSCLVVCDSLIARNDTMADAYYNAGVAHLNKAFMLDKGKPSAKQRTQVRQQYQKALPYMERYRELAPDQKDKWAAALYNIYLRLNMGKQFEEIDQLLR